MYHVPFMVFCDRLKFVIESTVMFHIWDYLADWQAKSPSRKTSINFFTFTDVRLVNGRHGAEGVVRVLLGDRWYGVCDDMWDDIDAMVVCRQLGYSGNNS